MARLIYFLILTVSLSIGAFSLQADDSYISDMAEDDSAAEGEVQAAMDEADVEAAEETDEVDTGVDDSMEAVDEAGDEASF